MIGFAPATYGDFDHGSFLRVEEVPGGVEGVLAEMDGAGAITWMWSANPLGDLVLQIDGNEIVYPFESFLAGKWLPVSSPFASRTAQGWNLDFPIIHAQSCRVSVRAKTRAELGSLFYQLAWNAFETDCEIVPFELNQGQGSRKALRQLAEAWLNPSGTDPDGVFEGTLPSGASCNAVSVSGEGVIDCLEISARTKQELADLEIEACWDGSTVPSLACPLHMLCGVSHRMEDVRSLPVSVDGARITIRWPMPYGQGANIRLVNRGNQTVHLCVAVSRVDECDTRARFAGQCSEHSSGLSGDTGNMTLASMVGSGKIVGCVMEVNNHGDDWWGEGDPVIWLDDSVVPAWHGTGSEDYFGCAWCSSDTFHHPFRGQTCTTPASVVLYRYHLMDALPFKQKARFDFEAVNGLGSVDYSTLLLWYAETSSMNDWNKSR